MKALLIITLLCSHLCVYGKILDVGTGKTYTRISDAAADAKPGDSIVCHDQVMQGGMFISNLKGTATKWIHILPVDGQTVTIRGGNNSIQFSDAAYVRFTGFIIENQTGNGLNIDDAGTYESPTNHIKVEKCIFKNINATGNNDFLKLSGLDDFEVTDCTFLNGAAGGSGIDMVGCHRGYIGGNTFTNLGSNSIQAKGGTSDIMIHRNSFENGGARALNIGGSTGLEFFRPLNANTEAERINVIANVIVGSEAAIAFVGCRQVSVSNNTIIFPTKWVIRILQETVDINRFLPCGENSFNNNIVIINQNVNTDANIGPNTEPQTFSFRSNLWWKTSNPSWSGPNLPGTVSSTILADPLLIPGSTFKISNNSPAKNKGVPYATPPKDIENKSFSNPPSIGAYEVSSVSDTENVVLQRIAIYPNPFTDQVQIRCQYSDLRQFIVSDMQGNIMLNLTQETAKMTLQLSSLPPAMYLLQIRDKDGLSTHRIIKK